MLARWTARCGAERATWSAALVALATWLCSIDADAATVVVAKFAGNKAEVVRGKLLDALEQAGHEIDTRRRLRTGANPKTVRRVLKRAKADASIEGVVRRHSARQWSLTLTVRDAEGNRAGEPVKIESNWFPGLLKEVTDSAADQLASSLGESGGSKPKPGKATTEDDADDVPQPVAAGSKGARGAASAAEDEDDSADSAALGLAGGARKGPAAGDKKSKGSATSAPESPPAGDEEAVALDFSGDGVDGADLGAASADASAADALGREWLVLRAGGGWVGHSLIYQQDIYNRLRTEEANIFVYRAGLDWYPLHKSLGQALGVTASFEGVLSGSVQDADQGGSYDVEYQELAVGLTSRHAIGRHSVGFQVTYGQLTSGLAPEASETLTPDLQYTNWRAGMDGVMNWGKWRGLGQIGFRAPFGFGEIGEARWFPRIAGYGIDAGLGLSYAMSSKFSLEMLGNVRRYLLEMNPQPDDAATGSAEVAAGAKDTYIGAYVGLSVAL